MQRRRLAAMLLAAVSTSGLASADEPAAPPGEGRGPRGPIVEVHRIPPAEQAARRGDFWLMAKQFEKAIDSYRKALALDPKHPRARFRLGYSLFQAQKLDLAVTELEAVLALDPKHDGAHIGLADLHLSRNAFDKAEAALQRGIDALPKEPRFYFRLGKLCRLRAEAGGDVAALKAKASGHLDKAASLVAPQSIGAKEIQRERTLLEHGKLGQTLADARDAIASGKMEEGLKLADAVTAQKADLLEAHYLRGLALSSPKLNRIADGLAAFKQAAAMKEALLAAGQLYYEQGEMEDAEDWLKKAAKLDDKYQDAHYQLGLVYKELGEYDKAIVAWKAAVAAAPRTKIASWAATKLQVLTGQVRALAEGEVLDPAAERHLGSRFMELVIKKWGLIDDEPLAKRLDTIARRLVAVSDRSAENLLYEIRIVNQKGINAITFPGGKIAIFKGMIDFIRTELGDSDDAWAVVLGHEIAHAALRHGVNKAKMLTAQMSMGSGANLGATVTLSTFLSGFSRANEFEADQYGCLYAYRAGFKPAAALRFHEKMAVKKEIPPGLGHPPHAERVERTRGYLLELRGKTRSFNLGVKALAKNDYARAIEHFELFLGVFPQSLAARNNLGLAMHKKALLRIPLGHFKKSSDVDPKEKVPAIALRAAAVRGSGALTQQPPVLDRPLLREAVAELQMAVKLDPSRASSHVNLAAALLDLGEREVALEHLRMALRRDPRNPSAQNNLAVAHFEGGQPEKGLALLRKLAESDAPCQDAIFNLAVASDRAGNKREAAKHYGRYAELDKESGWAKLARERIAALHQ